MKRISITPNIQKKCLATDNKNIDLSPKPFFFLLPFLLFIYMRYRCCNKLACGQPRKLLTSEPYIQSLVTHSRVTQRYGMVELVTHAGQSVCRNLVCIYRALPKINECSWVQEGKKKKLPGREARRAGLYSVNARTFIVGTCCWTPAQHYYPGCGSGKIDTELCICLCVLVDPADHRILHIRGFFLLLITFFKNIYKSNSRVNKCQVHSVDCYIIIIVINKRKTRGPKPVSVVVVVFVC